MDSQSEELYETKSVCTKLQERIDDLQSNNQHIEHRIQDLLKQVLLLQYLYHTCTGKENHFNQRKTG